MNTSKLVLASVLFAGLSLPASAASVQVSGMVPTLGGEVTMKAVLVTFDGPEAAANPAALYARINQAAAMLCSSNPGGKSLLLSDKVERCRAMAVRLAVRQVGSPNLTAVAAAR